LPLYNLPVYGAISDPLGQSHDIRAISIDFNRDGKQDDLVISRPAYDGKQWPLYSEVQFLENLGNGNFSDVTDITLKDYVNNSAASYAPILADFNGDGLTDIFLSESSWDSKIYNSTTILLQQSDGTFVDSYRDELSKLVKNGVGKATISKGPDNKYYLVTAHQNYGGETTVNYHPLDFYTIPKATSADDLLTGGTRGDLIQGLGGNDTIAGGLGNDTLNGGIGNDVINGGIGTDKLTGGKGKDTFVFAAGDRGQSALTFEV
jgi:Ca2+-binding RTX toxin-like protein